MLMKYLCIILAFLQMAAFSVFTNKKTQTIGLNEYETHQAFETFGTSSCWWSQTISDEETAERLQGFFMMMKRVSVLMFTVITSAAVKRIILIAEFGTEPDAPKVFMF